MIERIVFGVIIGFVSGFAFKIEAKNQNIKIFQGFLGLIIVAFISSSFVFGVIFGIMAICEIAFGFWVSNIVADKKSKS